MVTLAKIIAAIILNLSLFLCHSDSVFEARAKSNGTIKIEERVKTTSFPAKNASNGLDVYLTQDSSEIKSIIDHKFKNRFLNNDFHLTYELH